MRLSVFIILVFLLIGCNSKYALYNEYDLIEVPEVEGSWLAANKKEVLTFTKTKKNEYSLTQTHDTTKSPEFYTAKFLRLNNQLYMDVQYGGLLDSNYRKVTSKFNGHLIAKVLCNNSTLNIVLFNSEYLVKLAEAKKIKLSYELSFEDKSDYGFPTEHIITENTKNLQALIIKYSNDQNVFDDKTMVICNKVK